ncbi:flagellar motor switch protein FliM [Desulfurivibrio alkaliphilus]|uniref:Flagellar motor switch protein FliM n=1 Tax=Desulfurivibrio alkaliphilus (strain DSM 19089 / UNIQEM U267 / AHT2) TaxID=589865 RepID=D6Z4D2_DESAT|nr:flagellar motor switch protein FliM [Desulfurivibrio alkaliphilus]ADH86407.1 flagellar motor switch protein FliM [Desulfurivibrio alkaliphilus AHT 2]
MAEQILSQDEVDALLKGISGGEIEEPEEAAETDGLGYTPYDFTRQQRIVQTRMPAMDAISDAFMRSMRNSLASALRRILDVTAVPMELERFGAFVRTLPVPSSLQIFKMAPFRGHALIVLEPRLVFNLVESFLGGSGSRNVRIEGRDFTAIEQRLIRRVVNLLLTDMEKAWYSLQPLKVQYVRSEINPQFAKICQPEDVVIINRYEVDMDRAVGSITTCIPMSNLESVRNRLMTTFQREQSEEDIAIQRTITENIKNAEVEFKVELGRTTVPAREIINLQVGDTLTLDRRTDEQLPVFVASKRKYMATPGVHRKNNAVLIKKKVLDPNRD